MYQNLETHPDLASSLVLLKSPDWYHALALYPVSTLAANCNLIVEPSTRKVYMNVRRCTPGVETEVYVVRGRTTGTADAGRVVKVAVDAARTLVGGEKDGRGAPFWDGLGICTWESFGKDSKCLRPRTQGVLKSAEYARLQLEDQTRVRFSASYPISPSRPS